ncbi:MAG: hypothetical protein IKM31_08280, partial [Oscillospiraceae bacterium]|nr:hypothetical protein [Oscillospiraceae bacterium]
ALDKERKYLYCSFTTELLKLDLAGNLVGSVKGLTGHLGCLALGTDGRIYGSLEYKNDAIGKGILKSLGMDAEIHDAFYIAIFDGEKIDRVNMDAEKDGIMSTVYLKDVVDDFNAEENGVKHRFGCSGIDGITFAPAFGEEGKKDLYVAYGVYGDVEREDNDYQVILRYDTDGWKEFERPLSQKDIHQSGPAKYTGRYFAFTGNTTYGVQNLEYDPYLKKWLMAVYNGKKEQFPNRPMYMLDGEKPALPQKLRGLEMEGPVPAQWEAGIPHESGVWSWEFPHGSTGMIALGDGFYYFSENGKDEEGQFSTIRLYRWNGEGNAPFVPVG